MRVTNVDTLSAFIDRLISERIKLYHFETKLDDEKSAQHQRDVVDAIKDKLEQLLSNRCHQINMIILMRKEPLVKRELTRLRS